MKRAEEKSLKIALMLKERQEKYPELKNLTNQEIGQLAKKMYIDGLKAIEKVVTGGQI